MLPGKYPNLKKLNLRRQQKREKSRAKILAGCKIQHWKIVTRKGNTVVVVIYYRVVIQGLISTMIRITRSL